MRGPRPPTPHPRRGRARERGAWVRRLHGGGGRAGDGPRAAAPSRRQVAVTASGKQVTERKASRGWEMRPGRAGRGSGSGLEENPFPERGACLRPGCASHAGSGLRGRGLRPVARAPRGNKVATHGAGEISARPSTRMQMYVNRHANKQHLFASAACLGTFSGRLRRRARSSVAPGWGCGGRRRGREGFQRGRGKAARLPALPPGAGQAGAEAGAPRAHAAASRRAASSTY